MISRRTRETAFLVVPGILALVGAASVATANAGAYRIGPVGAVAAGFAVFVAMSAAMRLLAPQADPYLLPLVGTLTAIGLVELNRISPTYGADQLLWIVAGGVAFVLVLLLVRDHRVLEDYTYIIGLATVGLLLLTMVLGREQNGAKLWIPIGGGQSIQPGEFAKVLLVVFLAGYLRDRREVLAIPTSRVLGIPVPAMRHLAPVLLFVGVALVTVVVLNDFGTALLFVGILLVMLFMATGRAAYPVTGLAMFLAGSLLVYLAVPRIQDRVGSWINPFADPRVTGYQMVQSLYALAEGGVVGPGFGRGFLLTDSGRSIVPELRTDFIFTAVGNELGYVGALAVLLVFVLICQRGFVIAAQANDGFSKLLAAGLTVAFALQTFLIVGGIVRVVPLTGVTLPFMSYGGSSIVTNFAAIAILATISSRTRRPVRAA